MMTGRLCTLCLKNTTSKIDIHLKKFYSSLAKLTNSEVRRRRNELFEEEKKRQMAFIKRIEKIEVTYKGQPEPCHLVMNKNLSTPYNCAMHIAEFLMARSIVALVNGEPWDMHRPLIEDCTLEFMHMLDEDARLPNQIFWRSGSFVLGHILETAFKDDFFVELCSFPKPNVESGSFVYDADLALPDWKPTQMELQSLSIEGGRMWNTGMQFERLDVDAEVALDIFQHNRFKSQQIPEIASQTKQNRVTLYRMGEHVDICKGPLISSTSQIGRFAVTAVHQIENNTCGKLQRVQGIALPTDIWMHWWNYDLLKKRAAKLNSGWLPGNTYKDEAEQLSEALD